MKKKKLIKRILQAISFVIMIWLFIYFGTKDYKNEVKDNVKFAMEYKDISKNNVFKYSTDREILECLNGQSCILFMGFAGNIWSHYYAEYLNEAAMLNNIDTINYYDFKKDRELKNSTYTRVIKKLSAYLKTNDMGNQNLSAPTVVFVKNGNIIDFNNETSEIIGDVDPIDYFTDYQRNLLIATFDNAMKEYLEGE